MNLLVVICFLLPILLHDAESVGYDRHITLKPGVFNVSWYYHANNTRFYFKIQANTTGWAALGLTTGDGKKMKNLDIALGGVKNGNAYLNDYKSDIQEKPNLDGPSQQDLTLTSGLESEGKTVLEFNRLADTDDSIMDLPITKGTKLTLCFAIATSDTTNPTTFQRHSDKNCSNVKYDMYPAEDLPTKATRTSSCRAGQLFLPSSIILVLAQFPIRMVYWS